MAFRLPPSLPNLAVGLFAVALAAQQPQPPRRALSESTARILRERLGGEPFAVLAAWARGGRTKEAPAWHPMSGAPRDAAFRELVHGALWSDDRDTAYAAATLIDHLRLDIADIDRWLAAVKPHVFDEDPKYQWDTLRRVMSSDDVAWLLHEPETWFAEIRYFFLVDLHRSMRPEHIPALCKLTHHEDPFVRKGALNNLGTLSAYTDRYREELGRTLLEWPGPDFAEVVDQYDRSRNPRHVPRSYTLPAGRDGWSPLLRATLQRHFLDLESAKGSAFSAFLMRWAEDEQPAEEDRLLLRALLSSPRVDGIWIALRAISRVGADTHLRRVLREVPESVSKELVLAALGDRPALRNLAATDAEALAVALEYDFDGVWLPWVGEAFGDDAEKGLGAIERLADASQTLRAPYRPIADLAEKLRQAIEVYGARLDFARLHQLVVGFPGARSARLVELYWASITPANLAGSAVEVLEVSPSVDFTGRLVEWSRMPDQEQSKPALDLLLRLGDVQVGPELLAHWQQHHGDDLFLLARCAQSPPIREFLEEQLRKLPWSADAELTAAHFDALAAVAMVQGMPEVVAKTWAADLSRAEGAEAANVRAHFPAWRDQVLDQQGVAALVEYLAALPPTDLNFTDLGLVDDEAVHDLLRKVRDTPGTNVQWAIGELALAGDFAAKREIDEMRIRHLYGWLDYSSANVRTMGRSLDLVPWLIGEIETNCCRRNGAAWALQQLTGFDAWSQPEHALVTQHEHAQRWWHEVGGHLRWSRLVQRFVESEH